MLLQLLEAMVCVHRAGACHRALHPSNVFLVDGPEGLILKASEVLIRVGVSWFTDPVLPPHSALFGSPL